MELFYLNEHTSCYNYSKSMQEGFRYYKFDEGLNHEEELVKDCILFVLKGSLQFSGNGFQFTVSSGEMVFFCRDSLFNTQSLEKCEVVAALFEGGSMALLHSRIGYANFLNYWCVIWKMERTVSIFTK